MDCGKRRLSITKFNSGFLVLTLALLSCGCASTSRYLADRRNDLADIVTCTVGTGVGAKARVGPLQVAIFRNRDRAGLRGGHLFFGTEPGRDIHETALPLPVLAHGAASYEYLIFAESEDLRDKSYNANGLPLITLGNEPYYYTEVEVAVGLGGTLRVGVNPGEAVDFLLGWFRIDIYRDDLLGVPGGARPRTNARR